MGSRPLRVAAAVLVVAGALGVVLSPLLGETVSEESLWGVEPLAYVGGLLLIAGLAVLTASYALPGVLPGMFGKGGTASGGPAHTPERWSEITQQYFEVFHHDLGRPLSRIVGKERELRAVLEARSGTIDPAVADLLDEIERQGPNFRLMMSNLQVLIQLEAGPAPGRDDAVEPAEVVRKIVERYNAVAGEMGKQITWWSEPAEFGIVYSDGSAIEHIVTNLVDNAVRFAGAQVEVKLTQNPTHFFVRVWDDGQGIPAHYLQHLFDRGWTPESARRDEKVSSGLGLFIAQTLAGRQRGELTVESVTAPDPDHHTGFLLSLPLGSPAGAPSA
ncbi:MAG: HAMP domain-containing histidine kinase [Chloroflexi bacterium]|nr:HAMP domain-containing histidine kinase [Chloroflexota bacterium]